MKQRGDRRQDEIDGYIQGQDLHQETGLSAGAVTNNDEFTTQLGHD